MIVAAMWLVALAVGLLASAVLLVSWLLGRRWQRVALVGGVFVCGIYCLLGVDAMERIPGNAAGAAVLFKFAILCLTGVALFLHVGAVRGLTRENRPKWRVAFLLVAQVSITCLAGWRFQEALAATGPGIFNGDLVLEEIPGEALVTDRGRIVPVFKAQHTSLPGRHGAGQGAYSALEKMPTEQIHSNCHGWVFTRGRYMVEGVGVEMILADNGYLTVDIPRCGDVIVYRNRDGEIVHSGLVRAVAEGKVWVESKWGVGRRFIHRPENQSYSSAFAYYRTARQPDWLRIRSLHLVKNRMESARFLSGHEVAGENTVDPTDPSQMVEGAIHPAWQNNDLPIGAE